jgi:hypothetical protein
MLVQQQAWLQQIWQPHSAGEELTEEQRRVG